MLSCPVFALYELVELLLAGPEGEVERGHLVIVARISSSGSMKISRRFAEGEPEGWAYLETQGQR
jgi:hypothetical protein